MSLQEIRTTIKSGGYDKDFALMYQSVEAARERYLKAVDEFEKLYGDADEIRLFSAPGRTEVGGNHTDHQHGRVLAGSVDLDVIAIVAKNNDNIVRIKSEGYDMDEINLAELEVLKSEEGRASALIRGMCANFKANGHNVNGFDAYTTSNVLKGSGLSSSAAFEVLVCTLLNSLYNDDKMDSVQKAIVSQYAENEFFKKPCGLMDQMACSYGGFVGIDFDDTANPVIEKVDFDFAAVDHSLCIVDTGGCHADLTADYAGVPAEMKAVAAVFGKGVLRDVDEDEFYKNIAKVREKTNDRAVLRAIHFFNDNRRAVELKELLKKNDFEGFKRTIIESGRSSLGCLQNVFAASNPGEQGLTLALTITEKLLGGKGAFRVHGGGFAGTIQAFVPNDILDTYKKEIEKIFGEDKCYVLSIRPVGGVEVTPELFD